MLIDLEYLSGAPQSYPDIAFPVVVHTARIGDAFDGNVELNDFAGFAVEAQAVRDAWNSGERERAAAAVSDQMLESMAVLGTPEQCRGQLAQFRRAGSDIPIATFPHGTGMAAIHRTIEALAPEAGAP